MPGEETSRAPFIRDRETVPEGQRHHYDSIDETRGGIPGPFGVLLNSPPVAGRTGHLGAYIRYESELPDVDRELAIITTARELDCAFEWAAHEPIARETGVREAAIEAVGTRASVDELTDEEGTIVRFGRELLHDQKVSDATFESAKERYGVRGVVELAATFGYYTMLACVLNTFEVMPGEGAPELP